MRSIGDVVRLATDAAGDVSARLPLESAGTQQAWLDAVPTASAIVSLRRGMPTLDGCNPAFARALSSGTPGTQLMAVLAAHLAQEDARDSFPWAEGCVGGRHYQAHVAPLAPGPDGGPRLLVTDPHGVRLELIFVG